MQCGKHKIEQLKYEQQHIIFFICPFILIKVIRSWRWPQILYVGEAACESWTSGFPFQVFGYRVPVLQVVTIFHEAQTWEDNSRSSIRNTCYECSQLSVLHCFWALAPYRSVALTQGHPWFQPPPLMSFHSTLSSAMDPASPGHFFPALFYADMY